MHHVSALVGGEELLFRESEDRREFLRQLCKVSQRNEWRCDAYCLMGNHFHLIVYTVKPTLSAGMRRLCGSYAQWFNWKYDRRGHLFARRFMSQHIVDEAHLLEVHRYVALNCARRPLSRARAVAMGKLQGHLWPRATGRVSRRHCRPRAIQPAGRSSAARVP